MPRPGSGVFFGSSGILSAGEGVEGASVSSPNFFIQSFDGLSHFLALRVEALYIFVGFIHRRNASWRIFFNSAGDA
jgi:hypothetical protein